MENSYFVDLGSWYFITFIVGIVLCSIVQTFVDWLNSDKRNVDVGIGALHRLGKTAKRLFTKEKVEKALEYKRVTDGYTDMVDSASSGVSTLMVIFGVTPFLISIAHSMFPSLPVVWCWILVSLSLAAVGTVFMAPFEYYKDFFIEQRYGFNNKTLKTVVFDKLKAAPLAVVITIAIQLFFDWALRKFGDMDALGVFLFVFGAVLMGKVIQWAFINLVLPLFNKFEPLKKGELKTKLTRLCRKCGFKNVAIEVMDASRRSGHSNAFICGSFGRKRIVLFDTLLKSLTPDEVVAVVAHEIGHGKLHHLMFNNLKMVLSVTAITVVSFILMKNPDFYHAFGYRWVVEANLQENYIVGFSLAGVFMGAFLWILEPLSNWISRRFEMAADAYAAKHTSRRSMVDALVKLTSDNLSDAVPHPVWEFFNCSHPSLLNRAASIRESTRRSR